MDENTELGTFRDNLPDFRLMILPSPVREKIVDSKSVFRAKIPISYNWLLMALFIFGLANLEIVWAQVVDCLSLNFLGRSSILQRSAWLKNQK